MLVCFFPFLFFFFFFLSLFFSYHPYVLQHLKVALRAGCQGSSPFSDKLV